MKPQPVMSCAMHIFDLRCYEGIGVFLKGAGIFLFLEENP